MNVTGSIGFYISVEKLWRVISDIYLPVFINEQPEEEIHRARSGKVPSTGASGTLKLGCSAYKYYSHGPMITSGGGRWSQTKQELQRLQKAGRAGKVTSGP